MKKDYQSPTAFQPPIAGTNPRRSSTNFCFYPAEIHEQQARNWAKLREKKGARLKQQRGSVRKKKREAKFELRATTLE